MKDKKSFDPKIVDKVGIKDKSLVRYLGAIPNILLFQIITKITLSVAVGILSSFMEDLGAITGVEAITNSDLPYLFRSWQGICVLILGFIIVCLYAIFDINVMILISDNVLHAKRQSIWAILKEAILSIKYMLYPQTLLVLLFVVLIAPLTVSFIGVSLTSSFYIPDFILSVVRKNPIYNIPYWIFLTVMAYLGFIYLFTFQFMLLRKVNIPEAMYTSRLTMKKHWKNFMLRYGLFIIKFLLIIVALTVFLGVIPLVIVGVLPENEWTRFWIIFIAIIIFVIIEGTKFLFIPFQLMELNRIYESYTDEDEGDFIAPKRSWHIPFWLLVIAFLGLAVAGSYFASQDEWFEMIFPEVTPSEIVAHRGGGTLGNENTIVGLEAAIKRNVYGSEIDIQRTKDGHYIVNHDDTFERLCGVDKYSYELTLEECKKLEIPDTFNIKGQSTEMATLEEFLDASKGRIHLYIELKGPTADSQMVEDVYKAIVERDMLDEVTVISLKYDLISEMEDKHPEVSTGYLCFISLGNVASLQCDQLLLEDEMATDDVIEAAHEANKKVYIWTLNTSSSLQKRMLDSSDGIITDEVELADSMYDQLMKRGEMDRILDMILFGYR